MPKGQSELQTTRVFREAWLQRGQKSNWAVIQLCKIILKPTVIHFITFAVSYWIDNLSRLKFIRLSLEIHRKWTLQCYLWLSYTGQSSRYSRLDFKLIEPAGSSRYLNALKIQGRATPLLNAGLNIDSSYTSLKRFLCFHKSRWYLSVPLLGSRLRHALTILA